MAGKQRSRRRFCWAHFRHSVVGRLLAAPPEPGGLRAALEELAEKEWKHPITGEPYKIGFSTVERWYYDAKRAGDDPVSALLPKIREDSGTQRVLNQEAKKAILAQYRTHKSWSYQLHFDNLKALIEHDPHLGRLPSYWTVLRFMKNHGLIKQRRRRRRDTEAARRAEARLEDREVRGFEMENVNALWHYDFHAGSLKVLTPGGEWKTPKLLAILDDCSRLCCHAQWYMEETADVLVHGLCQAYQKRRLPRADMSDNGSAMKAAELLQGLARLGIDHYPTLDHSPYQNGKQEVFWGQIEGRLLPMLENVEDLTLSLLNEATLAWLEMEYNQKIHSEIGQTPLARFLAGPDLGRTCPSSDHLRLVFGIQESRTQRRSDGTISIDGRRFEIPSQYAYLREVVVRYARWDLSRVHLIDPRTEVVLCRIWPQDKTANADRRRRKRAPGPLADLEGERPAEKSKEIAPLLRKLMAEYAATGLPPAYIPKEEAGQHAAQDDEEETR